MRITFGQIGEFVPLAIYLAEALDTVKLAKNDVTMSRLSRYGEEGVEALRSATPVDSGVTADSWRYEVEETSTGYAISFHNDNIVDGWFNVALMLDVGHGTGTGGWVEGRNYIEPALRPIFDKIAHDAWLEVTSL